MKDIFDKCKYYKKYIQLENGEIIDVNQYGYKVIERDSLDCGFIPSKNTECETIGYFADGHIEKIYVQWFYHDTCAKNFSTMIGLERVEFGNCVYASDGYIFENEYWLTSFSFSDGLSYIPHSMFKRCFNLKSVYIPQKITRMQSEAFYYCESLQLIVYEGTIEQFKKISGLRDAFFYNPTTCIVRCEDGDILLNSIWKDI